MKQTQTRGRNSFVSQLEHEKEVAIRLDNLNSPKETVIRELSAINVAVNCISECGTHYLVHNRLTTKDSEQQRA